MDDRVRVSGQAHKIHHRRLFTGRRTRGGLSDWLRHGQLSLTQAVTSLPIPDPMCAHVPGTARRLCGCWPDSTRDVPSAHWGGEPAFQVVDPLQAELPKPIEGLVRMGVRERDHVLVALQGGLPIPPGLAHLSQSLEAVHDLRVTAGARLVECAKVDASPIIYPRDRVWPWCPPS